MSNKLEEARKIINEVDAEMAELFQKRMKAAEMVYEYKKEYGYIIKQIIEDFNSGFKFREKQAGIRLQELLNRRYSKPYTERILDVIQSNINNVYKFNI